MSRGGWDKVPTTKGLQRSEGTRDPAKRFLIVCEGKETEPNYFNKFGSSWIEVQAIGGKGQWRKVVEAAEQISREPTNDFNEVWCVFDRDIDGENPKAKELFCQALDLATAKDFKVAYSIDAFELWLLLHFEFYDTATSRKDYSSKLRSKLGKAYRKYDPMLYYNLLERQTIAIRNARKLHTQTHGGTDRYENDPSTTVYLLVEALLKNQ